MSAWNPRAVLMSVTVVASTACGSSSSGSAAGFAPSGGGFSPGGDDSGAFFGGASGSSSGSGSGGTGSVPALPPETKTEGSFQTPVATGNFVWIANPTSGRVAYIDATTFVVQTVAAGNGPTYLAPVPDPAAHDDVAIVVNVLSQNATLLRVHQGALSTRTFPSTTNANSWAVSAGGRWAIAWTDATRATNPEPTQGFQDVAVLDLTGPRPATVLAVGFRPTKLAFSADETHAYAVTQDGISVIDLVGGSQPAVTPSLPLLAPAPTPTVDASAGTPATGTTRAPDVSITSDGAYALVRVEGVPAVTVVSLSDGTLTSVPLPSAPTDLTLAPGGDFAIAVLRDSSAVAILPIPGIIAAPASFQTVPIPGETVGRAIVTKEGHSALLFTTAAPIDRLTVLDLPAETFHTIQLHAPVLAVFPTDDGQNAIVLHSVTPAAGSTVKGAFSIVPIAGKLPAKIVSVPAPPTAVALSPSNDRALVSLRDDSTKTYGLDLVLMPSLQVLPYTLASPPLSVGIAAGAARGYVAQDYAEGRITFVDLAAGAARTITGFELGARVVDGSHP